MKQILILSAFIIIYSNIFSQETEKKEKSYFTFVGISCNDALIIGRFNGKSYFETADEVIAVPKLTNGIGAGIKLGFFGDNFSLEFGYIRTIHDYKAEIFYMPDTIKKISGKAYANVVKFFNIKSYTKLNNQFKFYYEFDFSGTWIKVKNVSYTYYYPDITGDATYGGLLLGVGAGINWAPAKRVFLNFGIRPLYYIGTDVKGKMGDNLNIKKFSNFRLTLDLGVSFFIK